MRVSVGETLLAGLVGIDRHVALEDEAERTVVGRIVPDPVEEDDDLVAHRSAHTDGADSMPWL